MALQNETVNFIKRTEYKGVYLIFALLDRDQWRSFVTMVLRLARGLHKKLGIF
jgi:hypothetical protein